MKKIYKQILFSILFVFIISLKGFASHIVGGVLSYSHSMVTPNLYTITIKLYRDMTGVAAPATTTVAILRADGTTYLPVLTLNPVSTLTIPIVLPPCATSPSVVPQVEEYTYTRTVTILPIPGGVHLYYRTTARNPNASNIVGAAATGETLYSFIPCYTRGWSEDFNAVNGTTIDIGPTAWTRTTTAPGTPPIAEVNTGSFQVTSQNSGTNGFVTWASQVIPINTFTNGVNLSVGYLDPVGNTLEASDSIRIFYSLNGLPSVVFPVNGFQVGDFDAEMFATASGLIGNSIQIFVRMRFGATSPNDEVYIFDMPSVYDNTFLPNSSPVFTNLPPLLFCATNTFAFNQGATDADGDVLVYSMFDPYSHLPIPTFPDNTASIPTVTWAAGYSSITPFNAGGPNVTLNPGTGLMTGVQTFTGGRVFGVKCSEFRGGNLLSELTRDYEVFGVICPPAIPSMPTITANAPICAGQTLSLSATANNTLATYNWTGPNSFTSNIQSPTIVGATTLAAGIYSVTATIAGCTGPAGTLAVVVNTVPTAPTATANTPLCVGQTLSLTATFSAGATYNWTGPNSFTSAVQNPSIAGITLAGSGTYSVSRTMSGCTGPFGTVAVVVNPVPTAPTVGANSPLCAGQTLSLTSTFSAGATYSWTGPNSFTSSVQNPTIALITIAGSGTYSVSTTIAGCASPIGTIAVTVNPAPSSPSIGANAPICVGQTLSLTASFTAGVIYNWTGPNSFTSAVQNPTIAAITLAGAGVYTVSGTAAGCTGATSTINVVVNPSPVAPTAGANTPLCTGQTLSLTSTFSAGATYSWIGPNSFTASVQNPTLAGATPAATGLYSVTATIAGCTGPVGTVSVNVSTQPAPPNAGANSPICVGQTLSLTATFTAGLNYTWAGPNSFTSALQNPTIGAITLAGAGTYTVFATTIGGCVGPNATILVSVNPAPSAPTAGANSPLCVGQTLSLTATFTAGATYSWTGPNGFSAAVQNPTLGAITLLGAGIYSVSATLAGCPGPNGTVNVVVNPIPAAPTAASNSTLCAGSTLSLTSLPGGAIYSWNGPNSFTSTVQNPTIGIVTVLASGTYSVTQTLLGCTSLAGTVAVLVNPIPPAPVAGANSPICALQNLSLTANPGGAIYNWNGPLSFTSALQNPVIISPTVNAAGTYSVTQTLLGCTGPAGTVAVIINATPAAPTTGGTSTLCSGSTLSLTANPGGAVYAWTGPNSFTSALQNPTIPAATTLATGMYSVTATVAGCTGPAGTFSVNVFGTPSPPTLGSNSPLCVGQTLSLTATFIPGASYAWTGPNAFSSAVQNPTLGAVTLAASGNYTVNVNVSGCGSTGTVISVIVNPTPAAPIAGSNSSICAGSNLNLTANPGGGTYAWAGPNSFTSNIQSPSIVGAGTLASGMYSVTITLLGCTSAAGTTSVTVNPIPAAPTAASNSTLCAGSTLSLTALPGGGTFSWSGPNSFTSAIQNPTIGAVTVLASGTYSVSNTQLGCTGPIGTVTVLINPIPAPPTLGSNAPICALQTLSLSANPGGATYNWNGPNTFTSNIQNPNIVSASTLAAGTYSASQTLLGCTSPIATISIVINNAAPTPTAGSNSPICLGQTLNFTQTPIGAATYSWAGPNSFTSNIQNPSIVNAQTVATGIYTIYATVAGCAGLTTTLNVLVSQPGTVTAGTNPTVCANNSTVILNGLSSTGSGTWASSGTGTFAPNTYTGNYLPSNADILAGSVTLTLTSTNNGGCVPVTNTMNVFITPAPTASAGINQTVCANNATVNLSGSVTIASGGTWSTSGTGTFLPNNNILNPSYVPSNADITAGSFTLFLTTTGNGNCFAVTNSMVVTISPAPIVNPGVNPQVVCKNNPNFQLNGSSTTGSVTWASSGTGTFMPNNNILNPFYNPSTADTLAGSVTLTITSTNNGGCNPVSATMQIVYVSTLAVSAGGNQTVCANNSSVALNGISTTSAGIWTSSGTGTFSPSASSLITNYLPSPADILVGSVTLTLTTANNGGCLPIFSTMTIIITPGPQANAGPTQTVCANNATVSLVGSFSVATGGIWSSSGTGTFAPNNTTMNVNYIASPADTTAGVVTISLTTTGNGSCFATTSTMQINFTPAPLVNAGGTVFVCKNNPIANLNGYSSTGSGTWITSGTGTLLPNNAVLNPSYTPSTADTLAGSVTLTLTSTSNGGCNAVTSTVIIIYTSPPTITAGLSQTICANNPIVALTGTSSTGSGTWTSSGSGTFAPNAIAGSYIPSGADLLAGVFTLSVTSTNNGGCNPVFNQMTVYVTPAPVVNAGNDMTVCANIGTVNLGGSFTIATGATWSTTGTGTFAPNNSTMNVNYNPSSADTAAGFVKIFLTSTGVGNCLQVVDTVTIFFTKAPFVNAGSNQNLCPNMTFVQLNATTSALNYTWTTSGNGTFTPANNILNPAYAPGLGDYSAGSVTLILTSGSVTCGQAADTVIVNFKPKPASAFTYSNRCIGLPTSFTMAATTPTGTIVNWLWRFNNDTTTIKDPSYTFTSTGNQTVVLIVNNENCTDSIVKNVFINPGPTTAYDYTVLCHDSVQFVQSVTVSPGGISVWNWDFGDVTTSLLQNPLHVYADTGLYIVTLQAKSDSGCIGNHIDTVHVTRCANDFVTLIGEPAVPTGFTPNGDGSNDVLRVKGGPFNSLDFRIFNEWGQQIFRGEIQSDGWDGTFKNAPQPVGRFIWTVNGELIDGKKIKMAGETILSR